MALASWRDVIITKHQTKQLLTHLSDLWLLHLEVSKSYMAGTRNVSRKDFCSEVRAMICRSIIRHEQHNRDFFRKEKIFCRSFQRLIKLVLQIRNTTIAMNISRENDSLLDATFHNDSTAKKHNKFGVAGLIITVFAVSFFLAGRYSVTSNANLLSTESSLLRAFSFQTASTSQTVRMNNSVASLH